MIRETLSEAGLAPIAVLGLTLFFGVFVTIVAWTFTRRQKLIAKWSSLPLADGAEPVEARSSGSPTTNGQ